MQRLTSTQCNLRRFAQRCRPKANNLHVLIDPSEKSSLLLLKGCATSSIRAADQRTILPRRYFEQENVSSRRYGEKHIINVEPDEVLPVSGVSTVRSGRARRRLPPDGPQVTENSEHVSERSGLSNCCFLGCQCHNFPSLSHSMYINTTTHPSSVGRGTAISLLPSVNNSLVEELLPTYLMEHLSNRLRCHTGLSCSAYSEFFLNCTDSSLVLSKCLRRSVSQESINSKVHSESPPRILFSISNVLCSTPLMGPQFKIAQSSVRTLSTVAEDKSECASNDQSPPTIQQLRLVLITSCIPFIGFGFVDNFFMILLGDYFDTTLCVRLGFSTLAAAAWGNLVSDMLGIKLGESIEMVANKITSLQPNLSNTQMTMRKTRRFYYAGCTIGMALGCILGMFPLLFVDTEEAERRKRKKAQDSLFGQLSEDLVECLEAESVSVYIVEKLPACLILKEEATKAEDRESTKSRFRFLSRQKKGSKCICGKPTCHSIPAIFLSRDLESGTDVRLDITSGVPGLVFSTKKVVHFRPDLPASQEAVPSSWVSWFPFSKSGEHELGLVEVSQVPQNALINDEIEASVPTPPLPIRQAIGVPVFGADGDVIGVIEIRNREDKPSFTRQDKELLLSISSHIAVEIEGKRHITNILPMCRNQVKARRDVLKLSTSDLPSTDAKTKPDGELLENERLLEPTAQKPPPQANDQKTAD